MAAEIQKETTNVLSPEDIEDMKKHGITRVSIDYFHCGEFRYNNLKDAVAQAKRQQKSA